MKSKICILLFFCIFFIYEGTFAKRSRSGLSRQSSVDRTSEPGTDAETTDQVPRPTPDDENNGGDNERVTVGARRHPHTRTGGSARRGGGHRTASDDEDDDDQRGVKSKGKGKSKSKFSVRPPETDSDDEGGEGSRGTNELKAVRSGSSRGGETNVEKTRGGKQKGRWSHLLQDVQKLHGTNKHKGKKKGKREKFKNEKSYLWQGKLVRRAGPDASDPAPAIHVPEHDEIRHSARSCKMDFQHTSKGPSADGAQSEHFEPCQERKRGGRKRGRWTQQEQPLRSERKKRSESYSSVRLLWPDPERILIKFDSSYPESKRNNVRKAWQFWQNKTCLKFHEQPSSARLTEPHILMTLSFSGSCSTDRLGPNTRPPYTTVIDTAQCSDLVGSIAHELGHALGLAHSQKRVDRDGAVNVAMQNIAPSWRSQFDKNNDKQFDEWGVPYFYDSIMHYFPYASSTNGLMTICPLDPVMESIMGQREEPAFGDVSLINRIYCQESCFNKNELQNVNFNGNLTMTISGRTCQNWATQYPQKHRYTSLGNHESCRNPDKWAGGPWCYTKDPSVPYEPCFSSCEDLEKLKRAYCHGWCYNGGYHSPSTCECVCPKFATGKFCENINPALKYGHLTCGKVIDLQSGVPQKITSPNYPRDYGYNSLCIWWIRAPKGMRVKATVDDFALETADDDGCYDYLEIRKSICAAATNHPEDMRYCGNSLTPGSSSASRKSVTSNDENMVIKFTSDDHENAKGFSVTLQAV